MAALLRSQLQQVWQLPAETGGLRLTKLHYKDICVNPAELVSQMAALLLALATATSLADSCRDWRLETNTNYTTRILVYGQVNGEASLNVKEGT